MTTHSPTSPAAAIALLLDAVREVETERAALADVAGRTLAEDLRSDRESPALDVSAMDGYALRWSDRERCELPIVGEVRIGTAPQPLPENACLRIVTGAGIPAGADLVLRREDVEESPERIRWSVDCGRALRSGENIRRRGENAPAGELIVAAGAPITPALVGALANFGLVRPLVRRRIRVAVLSTGDELVPAATTSPEPWRLRDGNGPALAALLGSAPWIGEVIARRVADEESALDGAVRELLGSADALLLTGGVSMGHRDLVPASLARNGVRTLFHRVPQRPGRPVLGGITADGRPVLGLPGNPVSVLVTARRMAWPALARRAGAPVGEATPDAMVRVVRPDAKSLPLWWQRLVRACGPDTVEFADTRGSGDVVGAARSDGFVEMPPNAHGAGPWPFYRWTRS